MTCINIIKMMQLLSLNVGQPQEVEWNGQTVVTSIFKSPVADRRQVSFLNIQGDVQADLRYHGGAEKAVYAYDERYYETWKTILDRTEWLPGLFGENLTTQGLPDNVVKIGNIYRIGTATLQAIQPRFPCYKLNVKFGLPDMIERFYEQQMHGTYFRVVEEGALQMGDAIDLIEESNYEVTIQDVSTCFITKGANQEKLTQILEVPFLPTSLKNIFHRWAHKN